VTRVLSIQNRQHALRVDTRQLRRLARLLLDDLTDVNTVGLGICLVSPAEITRLNETFLGHHGPTDVITFDYSDPESAAPPPGRTAARRRLHRSPAEPRPAIHGELFICLDVAVRHARQFRTTWPRELVRYVVHGVLHLIGYDDHRPADRRAMKREENRLLRELIRRRAASKLALRPQKVISPR
jgi:rRNA maturation RNase YbeY